MESSNQPPKRVDVAGIILSTIGVATVISMAILAPNALQALKIFRGEEKRQDKYYINRAIERLRKRGLVKIKINYETNKKYASLTPKGHEELNKYLLKEYKIPTPQKWDGYFHVIIFDVEEKRREIRDRLRHCLEQLGFERLQQSAWVYPYECEEVTSMIKAAWNLEGDMIYIRTNDIENDGWLRDVFNLPPKKQKH